MPFIKIFTYVAYRRYLLFLLLHKRGKESRVDCGGNYYPYKGYILKD